LKERHLIESEFAAMIEQENKIADKVERTGKNEMQTGKYLTFSLDDQEYAFDIRNVTEIIGIQKITQLPQTPDYVKGVINLRGKVIPLIDVRLRFDLTEQTYHDRTCVIVVNIESVSVGMIVDTVCEVIDIANNDIETPPTINNTPATSYIQGLGKVGQRVKIILNTEKLLFGDELDRIIESIDN
jgi:purine-binding chemotaxis protein CheW